MTLGTGIFLSSIFLGVIFLYHSTKERWDWTKGWKRLGKFIVGVIILLGGFWMYAKYNVEESTALRPPHTVYTMFWDIELGASEDDVLFLKGEPTSIFVSVNEEFVRGKLHTQEGKEKLWYYDNKHDGGITIFFNKEGKVISVQLSNGRYSSGELHGIHIDDPLTKIERKLGPPDKVKKSKDKTMRFYSYTKLNTEFTLSKGKVVGLKIYQLPPHQGQHKAE